MQWSWNVFVNDVKWNLDIYIYDIGVKSYYFCINFFKHSDCNVMYSKASESFTKTFSSFLLIDSLIIIMNRQLNWQRERERRIFEIVFKWLVDKAVNKWQELLCSALKCNMMLNHDDV